MKRSKVSILGGALLAGALAMSIASPAAADPTPQPRDIVGVGSDTSQFAVNYLADGVTAGGAFNPGFNATAAGARVYSFDALKADGPATIVLKAGTAAIARPNGSTSGKNALYGAGNNPSVNFARSSSGPNAAQNSAGLWHVPFALDGLKLAVATTSNAPASISPAQMVQIYSGAVTNWNQIGGSSGVIIPMIPQTGSGTRTFFTDQLTLANGGTPVTLASTVVEVQEHDAAPVAASPNAVVGFSTGRFGSATGIKLITGAGSFAANRALYNVVRGADLTQPWFAAVFGENGFVCGSAAKPLIEASGFQQLATTLDDGVCGIPVQAATTDFTVAP